jgi:hypothetical protein
MGRLCRSATDRGDIAGPQFACAIAEHLKLFFEPKGVTMQSLWVATAALLSLAFEIAPFQDAPAIKLSDCPAGVRKTLQAEAKGAKIETVRKEKEDDETVYWADVTIGGKPYAIGVLEDGTLTEMNLAVEDDEVPFERCPAAVQATFRLEAFGEKIEGVGKDMKYGITIYESAVQHKGRSYEIVVAEDGTLVEKALVIEDKELELAKCPAPVQAALREHAKGGVIGEVTHSAGISHPTFEAEVKIKDKVYLIEVTENGVLIAKSLEAVEE